MACSGFLFFLSAIIILYLSLTINAQPTYRYHYCLDKGNYTANDALAENLCLTLSTLIANASGSGFYNSSIGQSPNRACALFRCRGDISISLCESCIKATSEDIIILCPNQKEAILWYDQCMLRYSNRSIFAVMEDRPVIALTNAANISETDEFRATLESLMSSLVTRAVVGSSGKMFASGDLNFTLSKKIYGLVECTPDISNVSCNRCLLSSVEDIPSCCDAKQGARELKPSCDIRYETYPFYELSVAATPTPSPPTTSSASPPSPATSTKTSGNSSTRIIAIVVPTVGSVVLFSILCYCFVSRKKPNNAIKEGNVSDEITTVQSLQFELRTIEAATNNFSVDNKIGEGGFGSVYKGTLFNGQQIAVKRLSRGSGQGAQEFKNEVELLAKLQHKNLVRLLGFCLEGGEKILIYEFVTNKSLDYFLFEPEKQAQLDWSSRYKIIGGIARGMLYLHEDSRLRIIHRDLKASNILLDVNMSPKISDFGMARIFVVDQSRANTNRIVGTYGYMSPEYVMHRHFSVKSDVFSFGVLVLEIISGKKNSHFYQTGHAEDLLSYAWKHWRGDTPLELMDPTLTDSFSRDEFIRCIHIGLLCVQKDPADRPTMATLDLMLNSFSVSLPLPHQPAFFLHTRTESNIPTRELEPNHSTSQLVPLSVNEVSITELYPR